MSNLISRRNVIKSGISTAGIALTTNVVNAANPSQRPENPPFLTPWSPPKNYKKDLAPGNNTIRLASWQKSTNTLDYTKDISMTELVKRIRDMGFTAANSSAPKLERNPWLDASESEIRELKTALKKYDVLFFDMHAAVNNIHPEPEMRAKSIRFTIEQCEAAERVGCMSVTTHPGTCSDIRQISPHPDNWTWETWKLSVDVVKQICKATSGMKTVIAIEPINMVNVNNPKALKQLLEDVADPRLKVCIDPVNMINMGCYFRNTELIEESFELLGEDIVSAHAKDTWVTPDKMSIYITEPAAGKGILDYETYLVRLSRMKWPRPLMIEHLPDEEYAGAKKYIENVAQKVGVTFYA